MISIAYFERFSITTFYFPTDSNCSASFCTSENLPSSVEPRTVIITGFPSPGSTTTTKFTQASVVKPVLKAITNQYFAMGLFNGLAIVALAIIFDRVSQSFGHRIQQHRSGSRE